MYLFDARTNHSLRFKDNIHYTFVQSRKQYGYRFILFKEWKYLLWNIKLVIYIQLIRCEERNSFFSCDKVPKNLCFNFLITFYKHFSIPNSSRIAFTSMQHTDWHKHIQNNKFALIFRFFEMNQKVIKRNHLENVCVGVKYTNEAILSFSFQLLFSIYIPLYLHHYSFNVFYCLRSWAPSALKIDEFVAHSFLFVHFLKKTR